MMLPMPPLDLDNLIRFWEKIHRTESCWNWTGASSGGKGYITIKNIGYTASRIAFWIEYKIDPHELLVCHECDNPLCVRPDHLWLGTQSENIKDCTVKGRRSNWNGMKLWPSDVSTIIQLRDQGFTYQEIADKYRVAISTIYNLCNTSNRRC